MSSLGAAVAAVGHVLAAHYMPVGIIPCAVFFGLFALPLYALCAAHLNDQVEEDGYVEASSGLLLLYASGAVVGPLVASVLMGKFGSSTLFLYTGFIHLLLVVFALVRISRKNSPAPSDKTIFSESLVSTGTVANLEPGKLS